MAEAENGRKPAITLGFGAAGPGVGGQVAQSAPAGRLRLLVIGDFGGPVEAGPQGLSIAEGVPADLPRQMGTVVRADVPNLLGTSPDPIPVVLPIRRLSDFGAKAVDEAVEPIRRAAALRASLAAGSRALDSYPDLDKLTTEIGPAPPPRAKIDGGLELDRLLGLRAPDPAPDTPAVAPGLGPKEAVAAADRAIVAQRDAVRVCPAFAALESTWRGLWLLLTQPRLIEAVQIDLLDTVGADAAALLLRDIVPDELENPGRPRPAAILLASPVAAGEAGFHALAYAAAAGEALQVPVIASLAQDFFDGADDLHRASWAMVREGEASGWLAAAYGDIVLGAEERGEPLWGAPGWAVMALLAQSLVRTGGAGAMTDVGAVALEGLDVHPIAGRSGTAAWPLRRPVTRDQAQDLTAQGVMVLAAQANRDRVFLPAAPCLDGRTALPGQIEAAWRA